jgi:hypothetical protein
MSPVFLDTGYLIALEAADDPKPPGDGSALEQLSEIPSALGHHFVCPR